MLEKHDMILGATACVLIVLLAIGLGIDSYNSPKQVYKIEYIDINNQNKSYTQIHIGQTMVTLPIKKLIIQNIRQSVVVLK